MMETTERRRWMVELRDLAEQISNEINLLQAVCAAMGAEGISADSFTDGLFALTDRLTQLNRRLDRMLRQAGK